MRLKLRKEGQGSMTQACTTIISSQSERHFSSKIDVPFNFSVEKCM